MTWIEISIVGSAVAFVLLIAFAVRLLIAATHAIRQVHDAIIQIKQQAAATAEQAEQLFKQTGQLTEEVHMQVLALEPTIQSIGKAGASIGDVASVLRKASQVMNESIHGAERVVNTHHKRIQDAMEWATTGFELWQRWQAHRNAKSDH
ncbi:hypothetical protein GCM10008018_13710 [Paenibacillus marchantiophytorum]|uniref:DUF948 domain-containing protein n=1 Tax=Paenibacillus marchantiophytorum TaxID=1619310 RepID=A0ABQ2BTY8_9BACL|nr:DUF948 domain-containing protein [Paenibacillus marchantiophytorum]GGI45749.1 hypothetical protein GCM10008018_13710 [Paenibacillus marchantiophytorum]